MQLNLQLSTENPLKRRYVKNYFIFVKSFIVHSKNSTKCLGNRSKPWNGVLENSF